MIALLILLVSLLLFLYQNWRLIRDGRVENRRGWTGYEMARQLLNGNGFSDVAVTMISKSSWEAPSFRQLYLPKEIYEGKTLGNIARSAREAARLAVIPSSVLSFRTQGQISFLMSSLIFLAWISFFLGLAANGLKFFEWMANLLFILIFILGLVQLPREWEVSEKAFSYLRKSQRFDLDEFIRLKKILGALRLSFISQIFKIPYEGIKQTVLLLKGRAGHGH